VQRRTIVVDGYNVIHRVGRFKQQMERSLEAGRIALLRYCSEWRARRRDVDQFYVVFDGDSSVVGGERTASAPGVKAIYSQSGETADLRIRKLLEQADRRDCFTVVSDDNEVRECARIHHMEAMSVGDFSRVAQPNRATSQPNGHLSHAKTRLSVDKAPLNPRTARAINDELGRLWDV